MGKYYFYDVYTKTGRIMEHVKASEIKEQFDAPSIAISTLTKNKALFLGNMMITKSGEPAPTFEECDMIRWQMDKETISEWKKTCNMFRNVEWVKKGTSGAKHLTVSTELKKARKQIEHMHGRKGGKK